MSLRDWLSQRILPRLGFDTADWGSSRPELQVRAWPLFFVEALEQPLSGAEYAVPWEAPLRPGSQVRTFWGRGNARTGRFSFEDAAFRIATDSGPFRMWLEAEDGTRRDDFAPIPQGGLALGGCPEPGSYVLHVEAPGHWGVTVVTNPGKDEARSPGVPITEAGEGVQPVSFEPQMPQVEPVSDPELLFACARWLSERLEQFAPGDLPGLEEFQVVLPERQWFWRDPAVVIITPGKQLLALPTPAQRPGSRRSAEEEDLILPADPPRNVAVISYTDFRALRANPDRCIPFCGILLQFASLGHTVWVFEGHPSRFEAGCQDADLLLVDDGMLPHLPSNWREIARQAMRGRDLWIHDRQRYTLTKTTLG